LYVTGSLGGAAAELAALGKSPQSFQTWTTARKGSPHLYPQPRIAQGLALRKRGLATAAMDLSDGLSTDLARLCTESGIAAEVDSAALPLASGASLEQALNGGEDYELLFTASAKARMPRTIAGVPITAIGRILPAQSGQPQVTLITASVPKPLNPKGWEHFS
jgi:thiamine-monophosphate kinase